MKRDIVVAVLCLAASVFLYYTLGWIDEGRARQFPGVVLIIMAVLSALLLLQELLIKGAKEKGKPFPWSTFSVMFGLIVLYLALMERIGFYTSGFLFFVAAMLYFGREKLTPRWAFTRVVVSGVFMTVIYLLFNVLLKVQTPSGIMF